MNNNFAIILLTKGVFGGAERRFTNLFRYLYEKEPNQAYYIVSYELYEKIKTIYRDYPLRNVIPIGEKPKAQESQRHFSLSLSINSIQKSSLLRKLYRFYKNYRLQKKIFTLIDAIKREKRIGVFVGVYSGILPLYFLLRKKRREVGIVFCNMDSWFFNISENPRNDWHKKYALFNYALDKSDYVDFLSPFILNGVRQKGVKISDERAKITACSFTDYTRCRIGSKNHFQIAFAGRLEKDKNPLMFLEAALVLANEFRDVKFHIMGEGRLSFDVDDLIKRSNFENIIFHGFHPQPTEVFAETSVFMSIQSTNNYPSQSVLEAMACGNAVIASDVGDTRMFINSNNGSLVPLNSLALIEVLREYIKHPEVAKQKGAYAAKYVREEFSIERAADYYLNLFKLAARKVSSDAGKL